MNRSKEKTIFVITTYNKGSIRIIRMSKTQNYNIIIDSEYSEKTETFVQL